MSQHIFLRTTPSLTPGRVGFETRLSVYGPVIASGFCDKANFPQFAYTCAADAFRRPYSKIKKTFLPLPLFATPHRPPRFTWRYIKDKLLKALPYSLLPLLLTGLFFFVISTGYENGTVNLRQAPTQHSRIIATLHEGDPVLIAPNPCNPCNQWLQVLTFSGPGWIYGEYIELKP